MRLLFSPRFVRNYGKAPSAVRRAFDKQSGLMLQDLHHPSLRVKKYNEAEGLWQARVNRSWRFYFRIDGDAYVLTDIIPHPK